MAGDLPKRTRGRPKTFDRTRTLEVAMDCYWREGVESVSVNEICRRAGVSKPGLYREFDSEDRLMDAALTRYHETTLGPAMAMFAEDRPFAETLTALIEFATRDETTDMPSGCLFAKMLGHRDRLGPMSAAHVDALQSEGVRAYAEWLERCEKRGEITLSVPLELMATYVQAQVTMMLNRIAAGEDPKVVRAHAELAFTVLTG